jgi:hypothetical protein
MTDEASAFIQGLLLGSSVTASIIAILLTILK